MLANIDYKRKLVYLILFFSMLCFYFVSDAFSQMSDSRAQTEVGELNNKVEEAYQAGKYKEGLKLAIEAYDYAKKNLGKTHPDTLTSLNNLAGLYQAQGRYSEAEPLYKEALASREKVLGKTHPDTLTSLNNLAVLYDSQGRYSEAEPLYKEVLASMEKVLGKTHPDTLTSLNNLAVLYDSQGRYSEAEPLYKEVLASTEKVLGKTHPDTLTSLNNMAFLYQAQGRYSEAEPLYKEALASSEKVLGKTHPSTLRSLNNLAGLYDSQGRYSEAEPLYKEALASREKVLGKTHPDTLTSLNNLAGLYQAQGRYSEAEPLYKEALASREKVLGKTHPDTLTSLNNMAFLYDSQGRYSEAEPLYKEALASTEKVLGKTHPYTILVKTNYVVLLINQKQYDVAIKQLKTLEPQLLQRMDYLLYATQQEGLKRNYLFSASSFQNIALNLANLSKTKDAREFAIGVLIRWKQIHAEEERLIAKLMRTSDDPTIKDLSKKILVKRSEVAHSFYNAQKLPEEGAKAQKQLEELERLELELATKSNDYRTEHTLRVSTANLEQVQQHLPSQSVIIDFKIYRPVDFKNGKFEAPHIMAVLIPPIDSDKKPMLEDLGTVNDIRQQWIKFQEANGKTAQKESNEFYKMLFGKFDTVINGSTNTLYIVPDGWLNLIAFESLMPDGDKYWVEKEQMIRILQTSRDVLRSTQQTRSTSLVAFGGVDYGRFNDKENKTKKPSPSINTAETLTLAYNNERARESLRGGLNTLPYSKREVDEISFFYQSSGRGRAKKYLAINATEQALKTLEESPKILHLSTHGFYLGGANNENIAEEKPLVLSGLALAGANLGLLGKTSTSGDDGLFYAIEALGLNLSETELVVLSACSTVKGMIDYSEGVYGLVRAFKIAGARSVLMTLWSVDDKQSRDFMVEFYAEWLSKPSGSDDPAIALREVKRQYINKKDPVLSEPRVWGPYVIVGEM